MATDSSGNESDLWSLSAVFVEYARECMDHYGKSPTFASRKGKSLLCFNFPCSARIRGNSKVQRKLALGVSFYNSN
ncbi:hypothetical protein H1R20_g1811, partial [Candolleomyces eurysporus]